MLTSAKNPNIERLRSIAIKEQRTRLANGNLWDGIRFSRSNVLCEALGMFCTGWHGIIADVLLRRSHANIFGEEDILSSSDRLIASLVNRIVVLYESAFKYQTISIKKPASRLALKNKWSLETGLHYCGSQTGPTEIEAAVRQHRESVDHLNDQLVSLIRGAVTDGNTNVPDKILRPLTAEDLFGSEEQWRKYAGFERLKGPAMRRVLLDIVGPHYDQPNRSGGFSFVKRGANVTVTLFVDLGSLMAQFCYGYTITSLDGKCLLSSITYEGLLGLGGHGWDSIATTDKDLFAKEFLYVDSMIRRVLD